MKKTIEFVFLTLFILLANVESNASWTTPVYIDSISYSPYMPRIAARNDTIFALCSEYGFESGNNKFVRSIDGGDTWIDRFVLPDGQIPEYVDFKIISDTLVIFYAYDQFPYTHHFIISTNFGESWNYIRNIICPFLVFDGSFDYFGATVSICGASALNGHDYSIVLKSSYDFGETWSDSELVFTYGNMAAIPAFYYFYGRPFIVVAGYLNDFGQSRIQLFVKLNHDSLWTILGPFGSAGDDPRQNICASVNGKMAFVFQDLNLSTFDSSHIFISTSSDSGSTWSPLSDISMADFNFNPRVAVADDTIIVLFDARLDSASYSSSLLLKRSYDFGRTWESTELLADSAYSGDLQVDRGIVHVVYEKNIDTRCFLYYRRWEPEGQGVEETQKPKDLFLLSNYPNPFNSVTLISYRLDKPGPVNLTIYDVLGRKVETIINADEEAGVHEVIWNAWKFPSGIYSSKLTAGGYSNVKRMLLVK